MGQVINTNIASLNAQRNLNRSQSAMETAMARLSSGLRINSAKDDAAGMAIATRFDAQTRGLSVASRNASDGISMAQTAEGALGNMVDNLQRLRELALQSANATNSDLDRKALDAEAQQLISEIGRISNGTNFNGIQLLNGEFEDKTFQIGSNVGETFTFSITQSTTDTLGAGTETGLSSQGNANALGNGDMVINGIVVGASSDTADASSTTNGSMSSIAKAAAINAVSDQTGVRAEVQANKAVGSSMTAAATSGSVTINDIDIAITTGGSDAATDRATVVAAINAKSDLTGVRAIDTGVDSSGVTLEAADGRNIELNLSGISAAATGLDSSGVTYGGYVLRSSDGGSIDISAGTGTLSNSGISEGTFSGGIAIVNSTAQSNATALAAGDLVINDVSISASKSTDDTASSTQANMSAISKTAAINKNSKDTGVVAKVNANIVEGVNNSGLDTTGNLVINGVTTENITLSATDTAGNRILIANAINSMSGQTGVQALDTTSKGVKLVAEDGRNIHTSMSNITAAAAGLNAADIYVGTYRLESAGEIEIKSTGTVSNGGLSVGAFGGTSSGQFLKDLDLTTVIGSEKAIEAIDNALQQINTVRADLGAVQNRLQSTINSLEINSENLAAAKSRIVDADFAMETAQLSRAQVLQQAGMSMLSQANSAPQNVLSLLQ
jgi:flagellin